LFVWTDKGYFIGLGGIWYQ